MSNASTLIVDASELTTAAFDSDGGVVAVVVVVVTLIVVGDGIDIVRSSNVEISIVDRDFISNPEIARKS